MATYSIEAFSGRPTKGEKEQSFVLRIWRRGTSTGQVSSIYRFAQPRNQSQSFRNKSDLQTPTFNLHYERRDRKTDTVTDRKTTRHAPVSVVFLAGKLSYCDCANASLGWKMKKGKRNFRFLSEFKGTCSSDSNISLTNHDGEYL